MTNRINNMILDNFKKKSMERIKNSKMPEFKYGLNILIRPEDFELDKIKIKQGNNSDKKNKINEEIKPFLTDEWDLDNNKVNYFNQANLNKITFIEIPKNTAQKEIYIDINTKDNIIHYIFIKAKENSNAKITINKSGNPFYASENIRIIAEKDVNLSILNIENFGVKTTNFEKRISFIGENSKIDWFDISIGSLYHRAETTSILKERNSEVQHTVIYLSKKEQKKDLFSSAIHISKETKSNLKAKGALKDYSKVLSRSIIKIEEGASDSDGYEKQDALILSENAEADAMPQLEIKNPNVKCSHGSTIGQIDKEKIFYLMSRGLDIEKAKKKIVEGYFNNTLEQIENVKIREKIKKIIGKKLK